jgi:hypothetical protein
VKKIVEKRKNETDVVMNVLSLVGFHSTATAIFVQTVLVGIVSGSGLDL